MIDSTSVGLTAQYLFPTFAEYFLLSNIFGTFDCASWPMAIAYYVLHWLISRNPQCFFASSSLFSRCIHFVVIVVVVVAALRTPNYSYMLFFFMSSLSLIFE